MDLLALAVPVLDNADRMSKGLEDHPLPYFLAIVLAVVGALAGALASVAWWGARGQLGLCRELLSKEERASAELKRERDDVRTEHRQDLVRLMMAAEGLVRIKEELEAKRKK